MFSFPPGTSPSLSAQVLAGKLRKVAGKTVFVDNKVGAGGNIATEAAARARPDGHILVLATDGSSSYNVHLTPQ
jgi:tripartite-type tricarboxylate transporter receptor subunit TctC